jgi:hypothetical protein
MKKLVIAALAVACALVMAGGAHTEEAMQITSPAFQDHKSIDPKYTCDGQDISPPLEFSGVPEDAVGLVLVCDDPDAPAGIWVHWVVFDMPADAEGLPENTPADGTLSNGSVQGTNSFGNIGYGGPCPPGGEHRYIFKLFAIDTKLALEPGAKKADVVAAMQGHILAEAQLTGLYAR